MDKSIMHKQPFVVRAFYKDQAEAERAHEELENIGVFGDWAKSDHGEPNKYKVIFTDPSINLARTMLRRINTKPHIVQVFDPVADWATPWKDIAL